MERRLRSLLMAFGLTTSLLTVIHLAGIGEVVAQQVDEAKISMPAAKPKDVESIDAILSALYETISGPAGHKRDWDRLRSLFVPGARLIPTGKRPNGEAGVRILDVEGYISGAGPYLEKNGFFEREIARQTQSFGNIAHVFSTYDSRHAVDDKKPFARGINSIQLAFEDNRWWVVTIFWDSETPEKPIPKKYLKSQKD